MKKLALVIVLMLLFAAQGFAQLDRSKKPEPGPAPKASFPSYYETTLANGLKVFVITNDAQPVVTFRLMIKSGSEFDGAHSGVAEFATGMLTSGTTKRSKLEFAQEEDFMGLSVSASASDDQMSVSGSGLKKYTGKLLDLMTDAIYNPTFDQQELDKEKRQALSGLQSAKKSPGDIMSRMEISIGYKGHPYSNFQTEENVNAITRDDLVKFHSTFFIPNNSSLAVVGDVTPDEIIPVIQRYFNTWRKGTVPTASFPAPAKIKGKTVHLVDLGATQSQTNLSVATTCIERNSPDYIPLTMANSILGGGFSGRLFSNLRETHGFTYGAYSSTDPRKTAGIWTASAEVRREATDSSVTEILHEMNRMCDETVPETDLTMHKQYAAGTFLLSLENPMTLATRVQSIDLYGLPKDYYQNYVANLMKVTVGDVQRVSKTYFSPENVAILAVGDGNAISEKLAVFGPVQIYDTDMHPVEAPTEMEVDVDASALFDRYIEAMGGAGKLAGIKDRVIEADLTFNFGPQTIDGALIQRSKAPNKVYSKAVFSMMGQQMVQEKWNNGSTIVMIEPMQPERTLEGDELAEELDNDMFNPFLNWKKNGWSATVEAKRREGGKVIYSVELQKKFRKETLKFDAVSGMLISQSYMEKTPTGQEVPVTMNFSDFREADGLILPWVTEMEAGQVSQKMVVTSYQHNAGIDDTAFVKN